MLKSPCSRPEHGDVLRLGGRADAFQPGNKGFPAFADIRLRDARDSGRADSPLAAAIDAVLLDTTEMSISQAADAARRIIETARARWEKSLKG